MLMLLVTSVMSEKADIGKIKPIKPIVVKLYFAECWELARSWNWSQRVMHLSVCKWMESVCFSLFCLCWLLLSKNSYRPKDLRYFTAADRSFVCLDWKRFKPRAIRTKMKNNASQLSSREFFYTLPQAWDAGPLQQSLPAANSWTSLIL